MRQDIRERIEQINNGQVLQGYIQTKFGIFPIDWYKKKFKDILQYERPDNYITENYIKEKDCNYIPVLTANKSFVLGFDINDGKAYLDIPVIIFDDFTVSTKYVNFAFKVKSSAIKILKIKDGDDLKFIYEYMQIISFLVDAHKRYYISEYQNQKILIPKLEEQQKISEILGEWDKAIELKTNLIEKLKTQKKALMQKLLTPKSDWQKVKMSDILKERKEYMEKDDSLPHVTLSKDGIYDKGERYDRDFLVKDENKKYKVTKLNDICYNPANLKFGVICRNDYGSAIFSPIYVTYEVKNENDPIFVEYFVTRNCFVNQVRKYEQGTVYERMAVSSEDFLSFETLIPKINQQKKIAEILSNADEQINLHEKELEQLEKQKKSLMQLLLTGIVRVN